MKPPVPTPVVDPCLKLTRRAAATASAISDTATEWRLAADLEALREREENLRRYEARLRAMQERIDLSRAEPVRRIGASSPGGTVNPLSEAGAEELRSGWEKFHRAVSLLQAEQTQLRAERSTLRADRTTLEQHEAQLAAREAAVLEKEQALATVKIADEAKRASATRNPWNAARSMFTGAKDA
jgi:DNA repair exonuclease SbcCD ATPase subunit